MPSNRRAFSKPPTHVTVFYLEISCHKLSLKAHLILSRTTMETTATLRRAQEIKPISRKRAASLKVPFLNDSYMHGSPSCSEVVFKAPRLRRCSFNLADIDWKSSVRIGGGLDGYLWKVTFGGDAPYAIKVVSMLLRLHH